MSWQYLLGDVAALTSSSLICWENNTPNNKTMDPSPKNNRAAWYQGPMKLEVVKSCGATLFVGWAVKLFNIAVSTHWLLGKIYVWKQNIWPTKNTGPDSVATIKFIPFCTGIWEGDQCAQSLLGTREKKWLRNFLPSFPWCTANSSIPIHKPHGGQEKDWVRVWYWSSITKMGFLRTVPPNTDVVLQRVWLWGESRS